MEQLQINNFSLLISSLIVVVAILINAKEQLGLEKKIIIGSIRAVIQLFIVGYILRTVFQMDNFWVTLLMILFMVENAAYNAHKNSDGIKNSLLISNISIGVATIICLAVLVISKAVAWTPEQVVPITGMIASNSMIVVGLVFRNINDRFERQSQEVLERLALGANELEASHTVIRDSIQIAMQPTIDSARTVGLVSLPGMMTGLIFAGVDPLVAIRYQIVITFLMLGISSISSIIYSYFTYKQFFNEHHQLIID